MDKAYASRGGKTTAAFGAKTWSSGWWFSPHHGRALSQVGVAHAHVQQALTGKPVSDQFGAERRPAAAVAIEQFVDVLYPMPIGTELVPQALFSQVILGEIQ